MVIAVTATRNQILDTAQRLIQARGFSAFSYADIARDVRIRTASIHHHFPTKGDLAIALMIRYREVFGSALAEIVRDHKTVGARLGAYQQLFSNVLLDGHRLCMCGMLAADFEALPPKVRAEVRGFFDDNEAWLGTVLSRGKRRNSTMQARVVLAALEGAMLVARTYGDVSRFDTVARRVLADAVRAS